jgi:catechol 2,3-dioxygenase
MALKGVLRPGYIQIRVLDMDAAIKHYVDHIEEATIGGKAV